jgi:hypothetical protein
MDIYYCCYKPKKQSKSETITVIPTIECLISENSIVYNELLIKSVEELHTIIILLQTKNYKDGITSDEYKYFILARYVREQKMQDSYIISGINDNNILITDDMIIDQ